MKYNIDSIINDINNKISSSEILNKHKISSSTYYRIMKNLENTTNTKNNLENTTNIKIRLIQ